MIESRTRSTRRRRRRLPRVLLLLAAGALLFLAGLGLGRALEQAPPPRGEVTYDRQLDPLPLGETVTVTVTETVP
jgi:hypothetical protein